MKVHNYCLNSTKNKYTNICEDKKWVFKFLLKLFKLLLSSSLYIHWQFFTGGLNLLIHSILHKTWSLSTYKIWKVWRFPKSFLKTENRATIWSSNPILGHTSREKHSLRRYMWPQCSFQHSLQHLKHGSNLNTHQQRTR